MKSGSNLDEHKENGSQSAASPLPSAPSAPTPEIKMPAHTPVAGSAAAVPNTSPVAVVPVPGSEPRSNATVGGKEVSLRKEEDKSSGTYYVNVATKEEFIITYPQNKRELFTELFAGRLIEGMKRAGLIPEVYHPYFVCADIVKIDGQYGLIQPRKQFQPAWTYFRDQNVGYTGVADRAVMDEMIYGQNYYYPLLAKVGHLDSLAAPLLISLLIGAYSVHSGKMAIFNVPNAETGRPEQHFGRFDWADFGRYLGHEGNQDVMNPLRFQGLSYYTQGYHLLYTKVPGLYPLVAKQAGQLRDKLKYQKLEELVYDVVKEIPRDLLTSAELGVTADYLGFPDLKRACQGGESKDGSDPDRAFANALAFVLRHRTTELADLPKKSPELMQASAVEDQAKNPAELTPDAVFDFAFSKIRNARKEYKEEVQIDIVEPTAESTVYGARFMVERKGVILLSPASGEAKAHGNNWKTPPLPKVLQSIKAIQKESPHEKIFLLPLLIGQRWTQLLIQDQDCYLLDPWVNAQIDAELFKDSGFQLKEIISLSWLQASRPESSGRFSAAIAGVAAKVLLAGRDASEVVRALRGLGEATPNDADLLRESAANITHWKVRASKKVSQRRGYRSAETKIEIEALLSAGRNAHNQRLDELVASNGFEYGAGDWKSMADDIQGHGNVYLQGKRLAWQAPNQDRLEGSVTLQAQINLQNRLSLKDYLTQRLIERSNCEEKAANEGVDQILAAYSSRPTSFMRDVLRSALHQKGQDSDARILIHSPEDADYCINLANVNGKFQLSCEYRRFPLVDPADDETLGHLDGPVSVVYHLDRQLVEGEEKWGWRLAKVETLNPDIIRALEGKRLTEEELINQYCVDPATRVVRHSPRNLDDLIRPEPVEAKLAPMPEKIAVGEAQGLGHAPVVELPPAAVLADVVEAPQQVPPPQEQVEGKASSAPVELLQIGSQVDISGAVTISIEPKNSVLAPLLDAKSVDIAPIQKIRSSEASARKRRNLRNQAAREDDKALRLDLAPAQDNSTLNNTGDTLADEISTTMAKWWGEEANIPQHLMIALGDQNEDNSTLTGGPAESIAAPVPPKTATWKYVVLAIALLGCVAAIGSGVGALAGAAGLAALATWASGTLIAGGGAGLLAGAVLFFRRRKPEQPVDLSMVVSKPTPTIAAAPEEGKAVTLNVPSPRVVVRPSHSTKSAFFPQAQAPVEGTKTPMRPLKSQSRPEGTPPPELKRPGTTGR